MADRQVRTWQGRSVIEGIGRPQVEASFVADLIDRTIAVPDAASIAAARVMSRFIGRSCGGSTGTNLWASLAIMQEMAAAGERGAIVTILCDSGERYRSTLFDDAWLAKRKLSCVPYQRQVEAMLIAPDVSSGQARPALVQAPPPRASVGG
jgi:cysteine synthase A